MSRFIFCLGFWLMMALFFALGYALGTDGRRQPMSKLSPRPQQPRIINSARGDFFFGDHVGVE
jgi:hypothetical protein